MHSTLRKNKKIIVWFVVVTFIIGGGFFGFGAYWSMKGAPKQVVNGIAVVNKEGISADEYRQKLSSMADQLLGASAQEMLYYQYQIINSLIEEKLLFQEAKNEKIKVTVTQEDVDKYLAEVKTQYELTDEKLAEALKAQGYTIESWSKEILEPMLKDQKTIEALIEKVSKDVAVTDQEVAEAYEKIKVSNIYVNKTQDDKGKKKIEEALAKVKAGEDFAAVAKAYSEAENGAEGGELGFIDRQYYGTSEESLTKAAFALNVGEISDVLETTVGYHILKVTDKKPAEGKEFDAEKDKLKEELLNTKKAKVQAEWFANVRKESKITINAPEIAGYEALTQQNFPLAVKKFEEANSQYGDNDVFYNMIGAAYSSMNKNEEAIKAYEKGAEISPTNYDSYLALGRLYKDMNNKEKAVENLKKASENAGQEYMIRYQIQALYQELGELELAKAEEKKVDEIAKQLQEEYKKLEEEQAKESAGN